MAKTAVAADDSGKRRFGLSKGETPGGFVKGAKVVPLKQKSYEQMETEKLKAREKAKPKKKATGKK